MLLLSVVAGDDVDRDCLPCERVHRPDQNTRVILLCPTPRPPDPRRNLAVAVAPSAEQLLAGNDSLLDVAQHEFRCRWG